MSRILPIPTTRVGDFFVRQRLIGQVQSDQLDLFRLQTQVSTGRRITLPSEDVPAALRAINIQRTLQRKAQVQTNLTGSQSVLGSADDSLSNVSDTLSKIRAEALGVADTISDADQRQAIVGLVDAALSSLVNAGNANRTGRYLFAGSNTSNAPFAINGNFVEYRGNEKNLNNYVDLGQLFATNVPGSDIFGGLSAQIHGTTDLDPQITTDTLLSTINGGQGLGPNAAVAVAVNNGGPTTTSIVDLSSAATVGDVIRLIEAHSPAGATISVDINSNNGLTVRSNVGTVLIDEVAGGRTARELGIFTAAGDPPSATKVGVSLSPSVVPTTPLTNLLGTKSQGRIVSAAGNNDIYLTAAKNGAAYDGATVQFVSDTSAGAETADYDTNTKTLTVHIQTGASSAAQVVSAINAEGTFTANVDYRDASNSVQAGSGAVYTANFGVVTSGGSGQVLDTTSGLILTNGNKSVTLDVSSASTVEDLLNQINTAGVGLLAQINATHDGIDVRSTLSGADFTIGENGGTTATQLGIRTFTGATSLADLNRGIGVPTSDVAGSFQASQLDQLNIVARNGTALTIDLTNSVSLQDVVNRINTDVNNNTGGTAVLARLTPSGNSIQLVDSSTGATGDLTVLAPTGNKAAKYLGLVAAGATQSAPSSTNGTGDSVIDGNQVLDNDLVIVARDGGKLYVDLTGATTVQDVIDRINSNPSNNVGTTAVTARLAKTGNGIELVDASTGAGTLSVQAPEGSHAAEYLGFVATGATASNPSDVTTDGSGNQVLKSEDRHTLEVDSVFNSLIRLRTALQDNNTVEIGRAIDNLDHDADRVNFARAEIGSRLQGLDIVQTRLQDENVQLKSSLSNDIDADLTESISNLVARQYALQASLKTAAQILNLSILDFI